MRLELNLEPTEKGRQNIDKVIGLAPGRLCVLFGTANHPPHFRKPLSSPPLAVTQ
jgi:hypothetical protein